MAILIFQEDFALIGQLAVHCDKEKLAIAIQESIIFDFEPLICENFVEISDKWDSDVTIWTALINGSTYKGCNDKDTRHLGLKKMLLYYIYARYTVMNNFNDTPNGSVTKTNDFSLPKPLKELEQFADKYRSMGFSVWKGVQKYLCHKRADYTNLEINDCKACGCDNGNCKDTAVKGYGIRGSNISKY